MSTRKQSRIARIEYAEPEQRLYFYLRDYRFAVWFSCSADDGAHLSVRYAKELAIWHHFIYNRSNNELSEPPSISDDCIIS